MKFVHFPDETPRTFYFAPGEDEHRVRFGARVPTRLLQCRAITPTEIGMRLGAPSKVCLLYTSDAADDYFWV